MVRGILRRLMGGCGGARLERAEDNFLLSHPLIRSNRSPRENRFDNYNGQETHHYTIPKFQIRGHRDWEARGGCGGRVLGAGGGQDGVAARHPVQVGGHEQRIVIIWSAPMTDPGTTLPPALKLTCFPVTLKISGSARRNFTRYLIINIYYPWLYSPHMYG